MQHTPHAIGSKETGNAISANAGLRQSGTGHPKTEGEFSAVSDAGPITSGDSFYKTAGGTERKASGEGSERAPVKCVDWSYPTSTNARRFGFVGVGCWTVNVCEFGRDAEGRLFAVTKARSGHATEAEAIRAAAELPEAWASWARVAQSAHRFPRVVGNTVSGKSDEAAQRGCASRRRG